MLCALIRQEINVKVHTEQHEKDIEELKIRFVCCTVFVFV